MIKEFEVCTESVPECGVDYKKQNKKARIAMGKVALMLFVFGALNYFSVVLNAPLSNLFQKFIAYIARLVGSSNSYSYFVAKTVVGSEAFSSFISLFISFFGLVMPAYIFSKSVHLSEQDAFNLRGKIAEKWLFIFGFCQIVTMFASSFSQGCYDFLLPDAPVSGSASAVPVFSNEFDVFGFLLEALCVSVFVPFAEEYVFRGVIFGYLKRYGTAFAVVASAAVFGAAHSSPVQSVYAFSFGIMAAVVTAVTGNLKTSILFHALNNFLTVFYKHSPTVFGAHGYEIMFALIQTIIVLSGMVGLYFFVKKGGISERFTDIAKKEHKERVCVAGIREIVAIPFVLYLVMYGMIFALTVIKI